MRFLILNGILTMSQAAKKIIAVLWNNDANRTDKIKGTSFFCSIKLYA
jgi:hypothetical protein